LFRQTRPNSLYVLCQFLDVYIQYYAIIHIRRAATVGKPTRVSLTPTWRFHFTKVLNQSCKKVTDLGRWKCGTGKCIIGKCRSTYARIILDDSLSRVRQISRPTQRQ